MSAASGAIPRQPAAASRDAYDLVIVGGGIQGACLSLEAARRGLRAVLLEKGEFGSATSANSLHILHGGLRYLQSADVRRIGTSIRERRWFCTSFPELVRPLACLMPLYGRGLRRPAIMRAALAVNDLLSAGRNRGVPAQVHLPRGRILDPARTEAVFPGVRRDGLVGSALWYDAIMTSSERILLEILHWSAHLGGVTLNQMEALGLKTAGGRTTGVVALDHATGASLDFRAPVVINCAGPWTPAVAAAFGSPQPDLFTPALAFNLLLDRPPVSEAAVAVEPAGGGRMMFLVPWNGRLMAGTYHAPWPAAHEQPVPEEAQVEAMLRDLNRAVPGLGVARHDVTGVLAGFMPAARPGDGTPSSRPVCFDHAEHGGAKGFYSLVGVKYTTARDLAERVLTRVFGSRPVNPGSARPTVSDAVPSGRPHPERV